MTDFVASPALIADFPANPQTPSPLALVADDPEVSAQARARLEKKSRLSLLFSPVLRHSSSTASRISKHRAASSSRTNTPPPPEQESFLVAEQNAPTDVTPISLDNSALAGEDTYTDRYEWAIVYENQRGITIFSTPYYSSLSLLPSDPSPFTLPDASLKRSDQPAITLDSYPLPDGNWHWVSRCWMIDMRTDTGEVQHDGFEYNWFFRRHHWRAQIGSFNAGGWVRRRRWVRLMVRPAKQKPKTIEGPPSSANLTSIETSAKNKRLSIASSFPSINTYTTESSIRWNEINPDEVWLGDVEDDWQRCRSLMKKFGRDGRKLELWRLWLGFYHPEHKVNFEEEKGKRREKQWTEDEHPLPSEMTAADILLREYVSIAPREHVVNVLRKHGQHMLHLFVFPESRAQFLKLLGQAGLLPELNVELGIGFGSTEIDFWSYASGLGDAVGSKEVLKTATGAKTSSS